MAIANYPQWIDNIVLVPKKDGKVRMCVNYRDLNRASLKDDFPVPYIDVLVDNTTQFFASLSWMDSPDITKLKWLKRHGENNLYYPMGNILL